MTEPLRILVFALGSGGDVFPQIALARALKARGHQTLFATTDAFEGAVRAAGLDFHRLGEAGAGDPEQDPALWKFPDGFKILFSRLLDAVPDAYRLIERQPRDGRTVVVANFMAFGARVAREKLGVPLATVHLQPSIIRSLETQPGRVFPAGRKPLLLRPFRRVMTWAIDRFLFDPILSPRLNAFRAELGLPPHRRWMGGWIHSPDLVLCLFPEWFAQPQPDWPPNLALTDFPLADADDAPRLAPEIEAFLAAGPPPVVFTIGTGMAFGRRFFEASAEACRRLGRRGILLTKFADQVPPGLPAGVAHFDYAAFEPLLPRSAALVFHGGIGTASQALRAGVPQLITPLNFDQPDNAARLEALGVAKRIQPKNYNADSATEALEDLLGNPRYAARAKEIAARFTKQDALDQACQEIEKLAKR